MCSENWGYEISRLQRVEGGVRGDTCVHRARLEPRIEPNREANLSRSKVRFRSHRRSSAVGGHFCWCFPERTLDFSQNAQSAQRQTRDSALLWEPPLHIRSVVLVCDPGLKREPEQKLLLPLWRLKLLYCCLLGRHNLSLSLRSVRCREALNPAAFPRVSSHVCAAQINRVLCHYLQKMSPCHAMSPLGCSKCLREKNRLL